MKRFTAFMMLLCMISAVLCGCSDGTKNTESGKGEATQSATDGQKTGVYYGGEITVGITQDLDSLDPHKAVAAGTKEVLYNIFEGLIKVGNDGSFIPAVASDYTVSEDGLVYDFTIRDGVKFHNGKAVTADDVIYSIKRVAGMLETSDPEVSKVSAFSIISDVNKTDAGHVEVVLSSANTEMIGFFTCSTCSIVPCDYDQQATAPVGTGAFKFVSYEPLGSIVLAKNTDYYVEGVPFLNGVTFKICADTDSAFLELLGGSIDVMPYLTFDQANQLAGRFNIESGTMNLVQALFLNNAYEPFSDIRVRQAICYAIDSQAIMDVLAGGKGEKIGTNMFPSFSQYFDAGLNDYYATNIDKAKQLLADAGYADNLEFTITVPSNYDFHVGTAQVIVDQLKAAGIKASIQTVEWSSWLSDVYVGRNYQSTIIGLDSNLAPSDVLRFYPSTASKNFINFSDADFDTTFEAAKATTNEAEKIRLYKQCEKILTEKAASAYIQSPAQLVAVNKKLAGYTFYPIYVQDVSAIYYTEEP